MRKLFTMAAALVCSVSAFAQSGDLRTNPESGSTVTELSTIELINNNPRYTYVEVTSKDDIKVLKDGVEFCGVNARETGSTYTLTLKQTATENGTYTLVLPAYSWALGNDSDYLDGDAVEFTYTIGGGQQVSGDLISVSPESGTQVKAPFSSITVTSKDATLTYVDAPSASGIGVYKGDAKICGVTADQQSDGSMLLTFTQAITEEGIYTVKMEEASLVVTNDEFWPEKEVPAMEFTYQVVSGAAKAVLNVTPAAGDYTAPIESLTLTSGTEGYPTVEILSSDDIKVYLDGAEFCGVRKDYAASGTVLKLKETMTESGEYKVVFPAGSWSVGFYAEDQDAKEIDGDEVVVIYNVDLGGAKYTIDLPEGKLTPNSTDGEVVNLADSYDGALSQFRFNKVSGELFAIEGATATVACKNAGYSVEATVTADKPAASFGKMATTIYLNLPEPIKVDGTYTITIPKGVVGDKEFSEDQTTGTANKAVTYQVTFTDGEPAPDNSVKYDLNIISAKPVEGVVDMETYTWAVTLFTIDAKYDLAPNSTKEATLVCEDANYNRSGVIRLSMFTDYIRTLKFTNNTEPSKNGTYVLTIPAGTFGDADWQEDPETGHTNPEIKVYYMVKGGTGDITTVYDIEVATVTPADGATVDITENPVEISFTANGEYSYYPNMKLAVSSEVAQYNGTATITSAEYADGVTTFTTTLSEPILVNGEYTITFAEGIFGNADYVANWTKGNANKAFTTTFTVTGGAGAKEPTKYDLEPEITPESGSQLELNQQVFLTFVFPEGTVPTNDSPRASLQCKSANYFDTAIFQKGDADGTYTLKYGTKPFREGTYTMTVAEGLFTYNNDERMNPELNLTWEIKDSAVDSILNDETVEGGVYNLNGVYVGESLENLPAGLYVVKGRKVAVSNK